MVRERIHLLQLLILNEYAASYAVARRNLGLADVYKRVNSSVSV